MKTATHRRMAPVIRLAATLMLGLSIGCGEEAPDDDSDDCDEQESMERCERCLDSCGPGCDASIACEVSCSGC
jgi:hypothetical protein